MARTTKQTLARVSTQAVWLAALGMLFIAGSFALLLRESFAGSKPVAEIAVTVDEIRPAKHGYLVTLKIQNSGNGTAASLTVEGVLMRGGTAVETSVVTLDYVAPLSERNAALFFSNDPRGGDLVVRPKGYIEP